MSDEPTLRQMLEELLTPLLPAEWKITPGMGMPETLSVVTLAFKHTKIEKLPESPASWLTNTLVMTIANPHTDQTKAEEKLDDQVLELLHALSDLAVDGLNWSEATKVLVNDAYLGWDITCSIHTKKKES